MRATEKKKLREKLEQKRREANEAYRRSQTVNREATAEPLQDLADQASEGYRKEFLYSLSDSERQTLLQVEEALRRMDEGTYEKCTSCGNKIPLPRLRAIPWTSLCIECQEREEAGKKLTG
jgi:RNA polymerase-binding protein DksA